MASRKKSVEDGEEFQKRAVACTKNQREGERKNKGEDIVVSEIHTYGETRKGDEREREEGVER